MPVASTTSGSSARSETVSARSPSRPRRSDGVPGTRVAASSTAPVAASVTATVGRQSGCIQSSDTATDPSPRMPEPRPTRTSWPVRYWRVRTITTRHETTASRVPDRPRLTASGATRTSSSPTVAEVATRIWWRHARVGADPHRVDLLRVGGDVGRREELVDAGAGDAERQPREHRPGEHHDSQRGGEHDGRVEGACPGQQPRGQEDRADHDRRQRQGAPLAEADHADEPGDQRATAGAGDRQGEEVAVLAQHQHQPGQAGVDAAHPGHDDRGLGLVLGAREDDRAGDQRHRDDGGRDAGEEGGVLDQQRHGAERHQQPGRDEGGTPAGRRRPRLQVALDDVGHRLDDVVVDPRRRLVDPGRDGEQAAVLDALGDQPGLRRELAALGGDHPVAAVDRGGVEQADAARQLGHELGQRHRAGQHEVHPAGAGGDADPHEPGRADRRLAHCDLPSG